MATISTVAWSLRLDDYQDKWTPQERRAVEEFLRAHDIEPRNVPVSRDQSMVARLTDTGAYELELWVYDRDENGRLPLCPHCPSCAMQKRITREVLTPFPAVSTAWIADSIEVEIGGRP